MEKQHLIVKWTKLMAILIFGSIAFQGCKPVLLFMLGMTENYNGITRADEQAYYHKHFGKYHRTDFLFDQIAIDTFNKIPFKPDWDGGLGYIQFKMFDKGGHLVAQYSSCEGPRTKHHINIMDSIPPGKGILYQCDTAYSFLDELHYLRNWDGSNVNIKLPFESDYVFVTYWVTFTGIPGRHLLRDVEAYINDHPEYTFNNYLVCLDKILDEDN